MASPKDVILKLAGILTVKGGTNAIIEYFGEGTASLSATGKATICNMGAEVGATTSLFPYDDRMAVYLKATGRESVAEMAGKVANDLRADAEVVANPSAFYDRVIEINLSELEPYINGPFTPDAATPISEFAEKVLVNGYPRKMEVGLIGSCTNSSYQDLSRAASIARQVAEKHLAVAAPLIVNPGSEQIRATAERDGMIDAFQKIGLLLWRMLAVRASDSGNAIPMILSAKTRLSLLSTVILPNVPMVIRIHMHLWLLLNWYWL